MSAICACGVNHNADHEELAGLINTFERFEIDPVSQYVKEIIRTNICAQGITTIDFGFLDPTHQDYRAHLIATLNIALEEERRQQLDETKVRTILFSKGIDDGEVRQIIAHLQLFPHLKKLKFKDVRWHLPKAITGIAIDCLSQLQTITTLDLNGCNQLGIGGMQALRKFIHLRDLNLANSVLTDQEIGVLCGLDIASNTWRYDAIALTVLNIKGCMNVTTDGIQSIQERMITLILFIDSQGYSYIKS